MCKKGAFFVFLPGPQNFSANVKISLSNTKSWVFLSWTFPNISKKYKLSQKSWLNPHKGLTFRVLLLLIGSSDQKGWTFGDNFFFFNSYKIIEKRRFKGLLMIKKKCIIIADYYGHTRPNVRSRGVVWGSPVLQCLPAEEGGGGLILLSWSTVEPVTATLFHLVSCVC